ncbi:MAG: hypothetical protein KF819_01065 [Labilithrix sp.]|nr:hypothetical protein [Labilithrix sp.]
MANPRRPTDTETAIEDAVDAAAEEVARKLADDGIGPARATSRDILRSRYPRDTVDDEAETEPLGAYENVAPSLAPFAVDRRPSTRIAARPRPRGRAPAGGAPGPLPTPASFRRRPRPRTFFSRAPSAPWILALMTLGGFTAFVTTQLVRVPAPSRSAASAGARPPPIDADAGPAASASASASATVSATPRVVPRSRR